jgi:short subunit dehydrogenase
VTQCDWSVGNSSNTSRRSIASIINPRWRLRSGSTSSATTSSVPRSSSLIGWFPPDLGGGTTEAQAASNLRGDLCFVTFRAKEKPHEPQWQHDPHYGRWLGIGRGLAEAFLKGGNRVVIAGRRREALEEVTAANPGMKAVVLDIESPKSIRSVASQMASEFLTLNVVINNAGIMRPENLMAPPQDLLDAEAMVTTNLLGPIRLTGALLPLPRRQLRSTIMNVSSGLAFLPLAMTPTYCAPKPRAARFALAWPEKKPTASPPTTPQGGPEEGVESARPPSPVLECPPIRVPTRVASRSRKGPEPLCQTSDSQGAWRRGGREPNRLRWR